MSLADAQSVNVTIVYYAATLLFSHSLIDWNFVCLKNYIIIDLE
jgi:hypothetical protein